MLFRLVVLLILNSACFAQTQLNTDLIYHWKNDTLKTNNLNIGYSDCWGYAKEGREYAIIASINGFHFFDITSTPTHVAFVPGLFRSKNVVHRDIKIYKNYAYLACDEGNDRLQVVDLSPLPQGVNIVYQSPFEAQIHNLEIDSSAARLYACSSKSNESGYNSSMVVFDLSSPENPTRLTSDIINVPEVHDAFIEDNIAFLNCGFDGLRVYDLSDLNNPIFLDNHSAYQDQGYNHQGWLSPDRKTYIFGDETGGKRLKKGTVSNAHSLEIESLFGTGHLQGSVPHNIMMDDKFAFVAYYNEGLRIYDYRYTQPKEIAYYKTDRSNDSYKMYGAWGIYSKLPSGKLIISDRREGLFIVNFKRQNFDTNLSDQWSIFPNPSKNQFQIQNIDLDIQSFSYKIMDNKGKILKTARLTHQNQTVIEHNLQAGLYHIEINYINYLGETVSKQQKLIITP